MHETSDAQLLRDYADRGSEAAFRELVTRHTDFVYSAAVRQVDSPDLAGDIAQSVFTDLARKARPLAEKMPTASSLAGWLHRSTRYAALNHLRDTRRRLAHERQAMEQLLTNSESAPDWERIRPALDEALDSLADEDREAILLRYFKNHDFRVVGRALGISDDTAQKRVSRAVERLREFFAKRGVTVGASGLVVVISANAIQAAPVGLAVTISTAAALGGTSLAATATATATKAIVMTTLQKTVVGAVLAIAVGAGVYEAREASTLGTQVQTLREQQASRTRQIQQLTAERDEAERQVVALRDDNDRQVRNSGELARLQEEASQLRRVAQPPAHAEPANDPTTEKWLKRVTELKQLVEQRPELKIPELKLLTADDWLRQAQRYQAETEDGVRATLADIRHAAKIQFSSRMGIALLAYIAANNGQLPNDILQLKPYFDLPVEDAVLQRYKLQRTGRLSDYAESEPLLVERAVVDDEYDFLAQITINGSSCRGIGKLTGGGSSGTWGTNLTVRIKPFIKSP